MNNAATLFPFWAKVWPSAMANQVADLTITDYAEDAVILIELSNNDEKTSIGLFVLK